MPCLSLLALSAAAETAPPAPANPPALSDDPHLSTYMVHLKSAGLLNNREATLEEIESILRDAQGRYVRGDDLGSAVRLFDVAQNPRFSTFEGLPIMASVQYHLGVALQSHGAHGSATRAYHEVISIGPDDNSFFRPALRRAVDIVLASRDYPRGLAAIEESLKRAKVSEEQIDPNDADELTYLRARALEQAGRLDDAQAMHRQVGQRSRFYTASLYLQGVFSARKGEFRAAEEAFCKVVGGAENNTSVYYVDGRYFPLRDLAQLGLGRVAHEELRHGHAFYHYFQVPQESEHLPAALFESAWTMAEEGEYAVSRGLIKELQTRFPDAPQSVEARLLDAMLRLYDCDFRGAEAGFTAFIDEVGPVADHIEEIRADPAKVRALHRELRRVRSASEDLSGELAAHRLLLYLVNDDPVYERLSRRAEVLRREASFAAGVSTQLFTLRGRLYGEDTTVAKSEDDALAVLARIDSLERGVAGLERQIRGAREAGASDEALAPEEAALSELRGQAAALRAGGLELARNIAPPAPAQTKDLISAIDGDLARITALRLGASAMATRLDDEAAQLASARLGELELRIDDLMGEARMGRIDAVLGAKKKLEIEVQSMAAGRFPSELFGKLQIEGMVGDDEEFWPYEGEYWADEYEGYR